MSRPSDSDLNKPESAESLIERIELLFEELSFAIQWRRPSILLVFYESELTRGLAEFTLEKKLAEIGQQVEQIKVDKKHFDIPLLLSRRPDRDRSVYFISGLSSGGGKAGANAYRALNMRREYFVDYSIRAILWLVGDEAIELSRHAPDFWAFRHRVVELNKLSDGEILALSASGLPERSRENSVLPEDLDERIELTEALISRVPRRSGSFSKRLDLLYSLSVLYLAKKEYTHAFRRLKQGILIARQLNNNVALAKFWGSLGSACKETDQLYRAIRAYRKAIRLNPQDADIWIGLGQTYDVEKRLSDAIIAYKEAISLDPQNIVAKLALVESNRLLGKNDLAEGRKK
jgi:tetratricopeptide (TPR) repeat protein